jgi:hypothetical protein
MSRKSVLVTGMVLIAGLVGQAAQAHHWGCWIQADRNVKVRNIASSASAAISDWNNLTILNLSAVSSGEETFVFSGNSGDTGWGGFANVTQNDGCILLRATAQLNTYYSWTSNAARGIFCQEVGHTFGLDHSNDGGCMGGGYWYDIGTHYTLVSHNINDIGSMYTDRLAANPAHPTIGPEADAPRFHAFWYNHPHSFNEAIRLSSNVVDATVSAVVDGDDIVTTHEAGVTRIPTQRVHFQVNRGFKGDLRAGESFVLFQNGNEENRFEEDPSYEVGARYLMFLTPREDGTYRVISPEGRYGVTDNGLQPAAKEGFAGDLKGASLKDVVSDVKRSLAELPRQ